MTAADHRRHDSCRGSYTRSRPVCVPLAARREQPCAEPLIELGFIVTSDSEDERGTGGGYHDLRGTRRTTRPGNHVRRLNAPLNVRQLAFTVSLRSSRK